MITSLLNDQSLKPNIDKERIVLVGFSIGGFTALAIGGVNIDCEILKRQAVTRQGKAEFIIPEFGDLRSLIRELSCEEIPE